MVKKRWESSYGKQLKITQWREIPWASAFDQQMNCLIAYVPNVILTCQFCNTEFYDQISFAEHAFVCIGFLEADKKHQLSSFYPEIIRVDIEEAVVNTNALSGTSTKTSCNREVPNTTLGATPTAGTSTKIIGLDKVKSASIFELADFPGKILLKMFASLELRDLLKCGKVSKRFRAISHDGFLWKKINLSGQNVPNTFFQFIMDRGCKYLYLYNCKLEVNLSSTKSRLKYGHLKYLYLQNCQVDEDSLENLLDENEGTGLIENDKNQNENKARTELKRNLSNESLNSDQETLEQKDYENQDMNIEKNQDIMIEQGCESDEKTSNSATLTAFFQLPTLPTLFLPLDLLCLS